MQEQAEMRSVVELLPWDSSLYGQRLARLRVSRLTPRTAEAALRFCCTRRVKGLYYLAPAEDAKSISCAEKYGFSLADLRVSLTRTLPRAAVGPSAFPRTHGLRYGRAGRSDIDALRRLAAGLFRDSRFAVDPHFGPEFSRRLFSVWIAKSVRGQYDHWVGVVRQGNQLVGFVSCRRVGRQEGRIGLLGVASPWRERGIGRELLAQATTWCYSQGIRRISVITQGRAIKSQRFYQACGFRTSRVELWYHKWF
jgi:TDP-D-fucosamine acetyltransferase